MGVLWVFTVDLWKKMLYLVAELGKSNRKTHSMIGVDTQIESAHHNFMEHFYYISLIAMIGGHICV